MADEIDVYQYCPCGSGKKLKFCCHAIVADMQKIAEMHERHQNQMALTALESLEKRNLREAWSRAWVKVTKALILAAMERVADSRTLTEEVLEEVPDHALAVATLALMALKEDGYPAATRAIYRAFQISAAAQPYLTSQIASVLAENLMEEGHMLAARQHLALAMTLDRSNEGAHEEFADFEKDTQISYPFRSNYALAPFAGKEEHRSAFEAAEKLCYQACFSDAAKAFGLVARQESNLPGLWWNIALCHAWAGEDPLAARAFRAAAANQPDLDLAAESLVLAELLDEPQGEHRASRWSGLCNVRSVAKLLTLLDQQPLFVRIPIRPAEDPDEARLQPAGWYHILDRDPKLVSNADLNSENIAQIVGQVTVFDTLPEADLNPRANVFGDGKEHTEQLIRQFSEIAGSEIEAFAELKEFGFASVEKRSLQRNWHLPQSLDSVKSRELYLARWTNAINDTWFSTPKRVLKGKSPQEAASIAELQPALAAAVLDLDIYCEESGVYLDEPALRARLGLPPLKMIDVNADTVPTRFSILEYRRLPWDKLTDDQLLFCVNRVVRSGHTTLSCRAIAEVLGRPTLAEKLDTSKLCMGLVNLYRRRMNPDEALRWLAQGKQTARDRKLPLQDLLVWELEELTIRTELSDDGQRQALAERIWNYYRPKLPGTDETLLMIFNQLGISGPWNAPGETGLAGQALAAAGVGAGGLWTPDAPAAAPGGKIWLPGQE